MSNEAEKISQQQNYLSPSRYISGRIIEYDIRSANISTLRQGGYISQESYDLLNNLPKQQREVEIGLMIKENPAVYTAIQNGIKEAKSNLVSFNNIDPDSIVRIANDAVYINSNKDLKYTSFGDYVLFRQKSISNVYLNLNGTILFLEFRSNGSINVDIKGIGNTMYLHQDYLVTAIVGTVALLERSGVNDAIGFLSEICEDYLNLRLPIGYYREFNSGSKFRLKNMFGSYNPFGNDTLGADMLTEADKQYIDINFNYYVLRELWSILVEIFSMRS